MGDDDLLVSIVDDDDFREALRALFRSAELRVATFACAEESLSSSQVHATACVVLDLRMPGMSGVELQEHLVEEGHCIPTVLITGHGTEDARARAFAAGAVAFLLKPFDGESLLVAVKAALRRRVNA